MFGLTLTPIDFGSGGVAPSYDTDAQTYITAVETADGQSLETGVKDAINAFVVGCKADGIWAAIKASCILAGARTLTGALVPLVGTAPTNNNFVSGDYSRTAGLTGNGATKYLDSNRANNADPQNDNHNAVYVSAASTITNSNFFGADGTVTVGGNNMFITTTPNSLEGANRGLGSTSKFAVANQASTLGLKGHSRSSSASYIVRSGGANVTQTIASATPTSRTLFLFARNDATSPPLFISNARLSFYSIGESLDLALLDSRVTALIAGMAFAVNTGLSPVGYSTETINYVNAGYAAGGTLA